MNSPAPDFAAGPMRQWQCSYCSHVYDEALGDPDSDIPPGTKWEDVPDDWYCPDCGQPKTRFTLIEG